MKKLNQVEHENDWALRPPRPSEADIEKHGFQLTGRVIVPEKGNVYVNLQGEVVVAVQDFAHVGDQYSGLRWEAAKLDPPKPKFENGRCYQHGPGSVVYVAVNDKLFEPLTLTLPAYSLFEYHECQISELAPIQISALAQHFAKTMKERK